MFQDSDQARRAGLRTRQEAVAHRRAQVAIWRLVRPGMSAEELAVALKCSPSTIRADRRALRAEAPRTEPA